MNGNYQPHSQDAMLSRIIQRLDKQDEDSKAFRTEIVSILSEIRTETKKTNGRVTALEQWRDTTKAKAVLVIGLASAVITAAAWVFDRLSK